MTSYRLSEKALTDLDHLYEYGVLSFGIRQADAYFYGRVIRFQDIADHPERYPAIDHIRQDYRRSIYRSHSIYYRIDRNEILIVRILGKQDINKSV